jgi:protoheme IX farnesyltransferase
MTPASTSSVMPTAEAVPARTSDVHEHVHIHAPRAGETASRIADYRELFKDRVTAMVMLTAWAGFYLGSMQ